MKEQYEDVELEVIEFESEDIITSSGYCVNETELATN